MIPHARTGPPVRTIFARLALLVGLLVALAVAFGGQPSRLGRTRPIATTGGQGYWLLARDGGIFGYGDAAHFGTNLNSGNDIVGLAATPTLNGYWTADDDGTVFAYGDAVHHGNRVSTADDIRAFAARPQGDGYWLVTRDGVVAARGAAAHHGNTPALGSNQKIVGMAATPSGNGYWLVGRDGGIFAFGDAGFFGSTGAITLNQPIVGMARTPSGNGYWFVAADGGVFAFGGAPYRGTTVPNSPPSGIAGMSPTPSGNGYWLVAGNGQVFPFGDAAHYGDAASLGLAQPAIAIVATPVVRTNAVPAAVADSASVAEDGSASINVLANDAGLGDTPVSVSIVSGPAHGSASVGGDSRINYSPASNYNGSDSITYRVTDGDGETSNGVLSISVTGVNDAPTASNGSLTTSEDTLAGGTLIGNDIDGNGLTYSVVTAPAHGSVSISGSNYTYTPAADYNGPDSFTFRANDGSANSNTATVSVTVNAVNDAPLASNISLGTNEDTPLTGSPVATDVDGDDVQFTIVDQPENGTVAENEDGSYTYTPALDWNGTDSLTYKASDGTLESALATVTIVVAPVNDAPVLTAPAAINLVEDGTPATGLTLTASDVDGDSLSFSLETQGAKGTAVVNPGGTYSYAQAANANGADSFVVNVSDGQGGSATAPVSVTITPVDDLPVASADSLTVTEDVATDLDVLGNDAGLGDGGLVLSLLAPPASGTATIENGAIRYVPNAEYSGSDSLAYRVVDVDGDSSTASVAITVTAVNDAPVVVAPDFDTTLDEDGTGSGTFAVTDVDSPGPFTASASSDNEALIDDLDFGFTEAAGVWTATYSPNADAHGAAHITVSVSDGGSPAGTYEFDLVVNPVNDAPVVTGPADQVIDEDGSTGPIAFSVSDVDSPAADLTVTASSDTTATIPDDSIDVVADGEGGFTVAATPLLDRNGGPVSITLTADDGSETATATGSDSFTVTVTPADDPVTTEDDTPSTNEDEGVTFSPLANDILGNDADHGDQPVTVQLLGILSGTATVDPLTNSITYTPVPGFNGQECFSYSVTDANGSVDSSGICVTVNGVNDAPTIADIADTSTDEDTASAPITISLADVDSAPALITLSGSSNDADIVGEDGFAFAGSGASRTVVVTPKPDANGSVTITITATDDGGASSSKNFVLTVNPTEDAPEFVFSAGDGEGSGVFTDISATGTDLGNHGDDRTTTYALPFPVTFYGETYSGTATVSSNGWVGFDGIDHSYSEAQLPVGAPVIFAWWDDLRTDGAGHGIYAQVTGAEPNRQLILQWNVTHYGENTGTAKFQVVLTEGSPLVSIRYGDVHFPTGSDAAASATVGIDGGGAAYKQYSYRTASLSDGLVLDFDTSDNSLVVGNGLPSTDEDTPMTVNVPATDVDGDTLTYTIAAGPGHGTATVSSAGVVTYNPAANYHGPDSFTVEVTDGHTAPIQQVVNVMVNSVNDAPVVIDVSVTTAEDTPLVGGPSGTDVDGGSLTYSIVEAPTNGTLSGNSYIPNEDFHGTDSFTYRANDGIADSNVATVTVTVTPVNDAPVAEDDTASGNDNAAIDGQVSATDVDGDILTYSVVTPPDAADGTLLMQPDGGWRFTPEVGTSGEVVFTYKATDDDATPADSDLATVTITVNAVPVAANSALTVDEDAESASGSVSAVDVETAAGDLTYAVVADAAHGDLVLNADGTYTYTPDADYAGADSFTFKANDGTADSNVATVTITVTGVNDASVAVDSSFSVGEDGGPVNGSVSATDVETAAGDLTYAVVADAAHGDLVLNADGTYTYTPDADYAGADSFTFKANDGAADSNVATVTITVNGVNDVPVAMADAWELDGEPFDIRANDTDVEDGPAGLTVTLTSATADGGSISCDASGMCTYTPPADWDGEDSFTYTVTDPDGAVSAGATVTITLPVIIP